MATGYRQVWSQTISITTNPQYSNPMSLLRGDSFSLHLVYTASNGTAGLQVSNNGVDWVDVTDTTRALSGSTQHFWDERIPSGAGAIRIKFTSAIGTSGVLYVCGRG